jgi:hypothetical protein
MQVGDAGVATAPRLTQPPRSVLERLIFTVFAVFLVSWFVIYLHSLRAYEFQGDDWRLLVRGGSFRDYFRPYNQHLSITPILVYRILLSTFGLHSTISLKVVNALCFGGVIVAIFLFVRSRFGAAVALVSAATMLWFHGLQWTPAAFNHWLALAATLVCAWALTDRRPSIDIVLGVALGFALCSSGVGVAGAVGCLAYVALSDSSLRRRAIVVALFAAWIAWWLTLSGDRGQGGNLGLGSMIRYTFDGAMASFRGLVFGNAILGAFLAIAFVANLAWRVRRGPRGAVEEISWTAAFLFWWIALAFSKGGPSGAAAGSVTRYALVGAAFLILATHPSAVAPISWRRVARRQLVVPIAILLSLLPAIANHDGILRYARFLEAVSGSVRQQLVAANLGPTAVPNDVALQLGLFAGYPTAGTYRGLAAKHGTPAGTRTDRPDAAIVDAGPIRLTPVTSPDGAVCTPVETSLQSDPTSTTTLRAGSTDVDVELRRFGDAWVAVGRIPARSVAQLRLPGLGSPVRWTVRAPGACLVPGPMTPSECRRATGDPSGAIVVVPPEVGRNVYVAAAALSQLGLTSAVTSARSAKVDTGVVLSQVPVAGTSARAGACVQIVFGRGR